MVTIPLPGAPLLLLLRRRRSRSLSPLGLSPRCQVTASAPPPAACNSRPTYARRPAPPPPARPGPGARPPRPAPASGPAMHPPPPRQRPLRAPPPPGPAGTTHLPRAAAPAHRRCRARSNAARRSAALTWWCNIVCGGRKGPPLFLQPCWGD